MAGVPKRLGQCIRNDEVSPTPERRARRDDRDATHGTSSGLTRTPRKRLSVPPDVNIGTKPPRVVTDTVHTRVP